MWIRGWKVVFADSLRMLLLSRAPGSNSLHHAVCIPFHQLCVVCCEKLSCGYFLSLPLSLRLCHICSPLFSHTLCVSFHAWHKSQKLQAFKLLAVSWYIDVWVKLLVQCYTFPKNLSRVSSEFLVHTGYSNFFSFFSRPKLQKFSHIWLKKKKLCCIHYKHTTAATHSMVPTHIRSHSVWAAVLASKRKTPICRCCCCCWLFHHIRMTQTKRTRSLRSFIHSFARSFVPSFTSFSFIKSQWWWCCCC